MKCTNPEIGTLISLYEFSYLEESEAERFESHLLDCHYCSEDLYRMQPVWGMIQQNPDLILNPENYLVKKEAFWAAWLSKPAMTFAGAACLLFLVIGLHSDRAKVSQLSFIQQAATEAKMRGDSEKGVADYRSAYRKGLVALFQAETRTGGFVGVDQEKLTSAIGYLNEATQSASALGNQTYLAQCYLSLGKAYLMKKDVAEARSYFEKILHLNQSGAELLKLKREASELMAKTKN